MASAPDSERAAALEARVQELEKALARSEKVKRVLMERVERSIGVHESSYAVFERNILLQKYVEERTADLAALNETLRAEIVRRQSVERELELSRDEALQSQREAIEANRAKSEFLANMSHEIRTPMNAIVGLAQLALRTELDPKQQGYVNGILESAESLLGLLNDILDLSKVEAGKMVLERIEFDLSMVLARVRNLALMKASSKGIALHLSVAADVPQRLLGDPLRLGQILVNLCNNAVKFTDQGGVDVQVELERIVDGAAWLRFSVRDTGIGIAPPQRARLFQAFSQADASTTRRFGGTGLGLAICKNLVEQMGGDIGVESTLGEGSCFRFEIPFDLPAAERPAAASSDDAPPDRVRAFLRGFTVLLAEDNPVNAMIAGEFLTDLGIEVVVAQDGEEVVRLLQRRPDVDAVLMDIQMPKMDGLEATRILRADVRFRDLPVLAMTAHGMTSDVEKSRAAGMDGHLTKPVHPDRLRDELVRVLSARNPHLWQRGRDVPPTAAVDLPVLPGITPSEGMVAVQSLDDYRHLLEAFLRDGRRRAAMLRASADGASDDGIQRAAHSLRSLGGYLGARRLADLAARVDDASREGRAAVDVAALQEELDRLLEVVGGWLGEQPRADDLMDH